MSIFNELKRYSPSDIVGMGLSFIWTKLFFRGALLIRKPFHMRGKKSQLKYGIGFTTGRDCRIEIFENGEIVIGEKCHIGDNVHIVSSNRVEIGNNCLFASKIFISDTSHGSYGRNGDSPIVPPNKRPLISTYVEIGNNVWLGENVVVLPGVSVGDGSIIGANSTVSKSIPSNCIAVGSPAKPIKKFDQVSNGWVKI